MRATVYAKNNGPWTSNLAQYGSIDATSQIDKARALKTFRAMNGATCVPSGKAKMYTAKSPNSVKFDTVHRYHSILEGNDIVHAAARYSP
jgi:hypothetical protein